MSKVTKSDITKALFELGIGNGDIVLVHSSFKSLGEVDGGAETVISGFMDAVGEDGTLVFPTFVQKDFANAYKTWHIDKESDTGYLTNYFRKREGSIRSDQATHSVAAAGKRAAWLTQTHGHTSKRVGNMGETPFAPDSPWEKMYIEKAKVVLLGVSPVYLTFRHYAESLFVEECLKSVEGKDGYAELKDKLSTFDTDGIWPNVFNQWVASQLEEKDLIKKTKCGEAVFTLVNSCEFVDFILDRLRARDNRVLWDTRKLWTHKWNEWMDELYRLRNN